jgi:sec-independent protein translocase protein TatC
MSDKTMSFFDHLEELRMRILYSGAAILIVTAVAFFFSDPLLKLLLLPSGGLQLKAFDLMDGFMIKWRIALYAGIVGAFPVWSYNVFRYVSPGLKDDERRAIFSPLIAAFILFIMGTLFGYYLLWGMIHVLIELFPSNVQFLPAADGYISFVIFFMLACGLAFQLPTVLVILVRLHILTADILRKQRRIAYFILFALAEIITPVSDPIVAPLTVMVPLIALYEISIFAALRIEAGRRKKDLETEAPT